MKEMTFGDLRLAPTGRTVHVRGQSAGKVDDLRGTAELFSVRSPEWEMIIRHNRWDNGQQDIALHDRGTAPQRFDRFRSARRLGIHPVPTGGACFLELKQAQMGENDHPTLRQVGLADLSLVAGCDVNLVLVRMGATVGTRSSLIGDTGSHGSICCARFPARPLKWRWLPTSSRVSRPSISRSGLSFSEARSQVAGRSGGAKRSASVLLAEG
jgi:hypothetical protein